MYFDVFLLIWISDTYKYNTLHNPEHKIRLELRLFDYILLKCNKFRFYYRRHHKDHLEIYKWFTI